MKIWLSPHFSPASILAALVFTSQVFNLKPTSIGFSTFVESRSWRASRNCWMDM